MEKFIKVNGGRIKQMDTAVYSLTMELNLSVSFYFISLKINKKGK